MKPILKADLLRLRKNPLLILGILVSVIYSVAGILIIYEWNKSNADISAIKMSDYAFWPITVIPMIMAVFCCMFTGEDYDNGAIRNKLICGSRRKDVYMSSFITCSIAGIIFCTVLLAGSGITSAMCYGSLGISIGRYLYICFACVMLTIAYAAMFNFVAMFALDKRFSAGAGLLLVISGNIVASNISSVLYLEHTSAGFERTFYGWLLNVFPSGQAQAIGEYTPNHLIFMPVFSIIIIILFNTLGRIVIKQKDIK